MTKQDSRSEAGEEAGRLRLFFWFLAVRRFFWENGEGGETAETK